MNLEGKKINFLGDSITEGHPLDNKDDIYLNILKRECKLSEARNYGIGGTHIAYQRVPSAWPEMDLYFAGRVNLMDPDADIVVVFGGTNDYGAGDAPLGNPTDTDPMTFYGALEHLIGWLKKAFPGKQLVFLTPMRREGDEGPCPYKRDYMSLTEAELEQVELPLKAYVDAIINKCQEHGIPVCNLYEELPVRLNLEEHKKLYSADGLHPNEAAHRILADYVKAFLEGLE